MTLQCVKGNWKLLLVYIQISLLHASSNFKSHKSVHICTYVIQDNEDGIYKFPQKGWK